MVDRHVEIGGKKINLIEVKTQETDGSYIIKYVLPQHHNCKSCGYQYSSLIQKYEDVQSEMRSLNKGYRCQWLRQLCNKQCWNLGSLLAGLDRQIKFMDSVGICQHKSPIFYYDDGKVSDKPYIGPAKKEVVGVVPELEDIHSDEKKE